MLSQRLKSVVKRPIEARLDAEADRFMGARPDFSHPPGEPALSGPDSVSWRIFKNPVTLFVGGVTAVLLEFADPRVRAGVWDHSTFRTDPVARMRRTGMAAMVTVYGARSVAERMIAGVRRMHDRVVGETPDGRAYRANDPDLLTWVHATASYGFLAAYDAYAYPLSRADRDRYYAEGGRAAALYGAQAPADVAEQEALFADWAPRFEASPIVFEFIDIMRRAPALPGGMRLSQRVFVRAAVDLLPMSARAALGLDARYGLRPFEETVVRRMARRADRLALRSSPPALACVRMGLPADYLYRTRR
ncbi:MAG: oxygenase MpaB family protein [Parvularculaceae bacterium]